LPPARGRHPLDSRQIRHILRLILVTTVCSLKSRVSAGRKRPVAFTRTRIIRARTMITSENSLTDGAATSTAQFPAVACLRPKRRWKASGSVSPSAHLPSPITGTAPRCPRLKKSGHAVQLWSSKPMHRELRAAGKLSVRSTFQELVGQIRDSVSVAHFSHSH
jgi:hypothetical protein